jgi:peptide/nickel transport system substrate-binding protein
MLRLRRKLLLTVSVVVALAMVLGACGAPTPGPSLAPTAIPATKAPTPSEMATPTGVSRPQPTGELIAVRQDEPSQLDWKDMVSSGELWTTAGIMETLTDYDFEAGGGKLRPVLALSWEWDGDLTWTFMLRQGVKFHNGEPFNAEAVVYSFNRMADPETSMLAGRLDNMASITAIDDWTVEIKTKEPDPIFDARLRELPIGPPKWTEENPDLVATILIGTGPYKFVEFKRGEDFKMTANEDYWGELPHIKDITILFRTEPSVRAAMVRAGEAQLAWVIDPEDIPNVPKVVQYPDLTVIMMRVDCTGQNPALADQRVRQAMLYAIDSETVMETVFKDTAIQVKGNQQVPPSVLGYDPTMEPWPYDPDKARRLLSEAQADGVPIDTLMTIYQRGTGWFARDSEFAEYAMNAWREIGLNVNLEVLESAAWVDLLRAVGPEEDHADLQYTTHRLNVLDYSDSANRYLISNGSYSLWRDERTDEMLRAAGKLGGDERVKAYQEVAQYLEEQVPFLVFGNAVETHATSANLQMEVRADGRPGFEKMSFSD